MSHTVVDLRGGFQSAGEAPRFGDDATHQQFVRRCEAQRQTQRSRFAVAPLARVRLADGTFRATGEPIEPAEVADPERWRRMLRRAEIIERYDWPSDGEPPEAA